MFALPNLLNINQAAHLICELRRLGVFTIEQVHMRCYASFLI